MLREPRNPVHRSRLILRMQLVSYIGTRWSAIASSYVMEVKPSERRLTTALSSTSLMTCSGRWENWFKR